MLIAVMIESRYCVYVHAASRLHTLAEKTSLIVRPSHLMLWYY